MDEENLLILMVYLIQSNRQFWTLPGGGLEGNETPKEACIREFKEETGLEVEVERLLFTYKSEHPDRVSKTNCFLVKANKPYSISLGSDPEKAGCQELTEIKWKSIIEFRGDIQVSKVIKALALNLKID